MLWSLRNYNELFADFEPFYAEMVVKGDVFLCAGDMNIDESNVFSPYCQRYLDLLKAFYLTQLQELLLLNRLFWITLLHDFQAL